MLSNMTARVTMNPRSAPSIRSLVVPRPLAWLSVDDESVCLLDGFTGASYTPPSIIFGSKSLPAKVWETLKQSKKCTLSSCTVRETDAAYTTAIQKPTKMFPFSDLNLKKVKSKEEYPSAIETAPIHMFCDLHAAVPLADDDEMVVLTVETFVIDGSVQSSPTEEMKKRPGVVSKIDVDLIRPVVSLGNNSVQPLSALRSLPRPKKEEDGSWSSKNFECELEQSSEKESFETVEWSYKIHGGTCPLGYNATTALVMPRSIGWISTYSKDKRVSHLAPYSFSVDVAGGSTPFIAFSAYRKEGTIKKDAHLDAGETKCFVYNMVEKSNVVAMNYSAAEVGREESEFALSGAEQGVADTVDAPTVASARVRMECEYFKTFDLASFSIVIGKVVGINVDPSVLKDGSIDTSKLEPVSRLGYMDEYGVV